MKNISAATTFIDGMSHASRIMDLMVNVRLPQETFATDQQLEAALADTRKVHILGVGWGGGGGKNPIGRNQKNTNRKSRSDIRGKI